MADGTVGIRQSESPDRLVDNEVLVVGGQTVYRERIVAPAVESALSAILVELSPLKTLMDDVGGGVMYVGDAEPGSATSGVLWRIKRITDTGDVTVEWADGNAEFDNVWDNRASLDYS